MPILNLIVHEIQKTEPEKKGAESPKAKITFRPGENEVNEHSEKLSHQLRELFRKTGLSTGEFSKPSDEGEVDPKFKKLLEEYFDGQRFSNFVDFSQDATRLFKQELDRSTSSKGGYLWFNHYEYSGDHFLSVVLLRKKMGLKLEKDLSLDEVEQLDLDKLHMAARLNMSSWLNGDSNRYISFRVGRGAAEVTDYFSLFIGCAEYRRDKADTNNMINALMDYCDHHGWKSEKVENIKQSLYEKCLAWISDDQPVLVDSISEYLDVLHLGNDAEKGIFLSIAQGEDYMLSNNIPINRQSLNKLKRYFGKNSNVSVSFKSEVLDRTIFYNKTKKELLIKDVPDDLKAQLERR